MSELVAKVARAIGTCPDWKCPGWEPEARAAIAAVAEWLSAAIHPEENAHHVREELLKQLEQPR